MGLSTAVSLHVPSLLQIGPEQERSHLLLLSFFPLLSSTPLALSHKTRPLGETKSLGQNGPMNSASSLIWASWGEKPVPCARVPSASSTQGKESSCHTGQLPSHQQPLWSQGQWLLHGKMPELAFSVLHLHQAGLRLLVSNPQVMQDDTFTPPYKSHFSSLKRVFFSPTLLLPCLYRVSSIMGLLQDFAIMQR